MDEVEEALLATEALFRLGHTPERFWWFSKGRVAHLLIQEGGKWALCWQPYDGQQRTKEAPEFRHICRQCMRTYSLPDKGDWL